MRTISLSQGSPDWHAHRTQHLNASDAPSMMDCSPYKTRAELVRERATGISQEFTPQQQAILNSGHRFEELARPLAEEIIGEELYPVVGVADEGKHSASFDGLTMLEETSFEHKHLNARLREAMFDGCTGADLPMDYQIQLEHQHMVSVATEKTLFMASEWDDDDTLIEERHCWYTPNLELRAKIVAGWKQFEADVAAYEPTPAAAPAPVAKIVAHLPVVFDMRVEGKLVSCNLDQYKPAALEYIAEINTELVTDQHFADAEADAKFCRDSAAKLKMAIKQAIGQMGDINSAISTVEEIAKAFDAKGLSLEKLVKTEKDARREGIVTDGSAALRSHIEGLNKRLGKPYMPAVASDFGNAVKGKRNLDSMRDAVNTELARAKIAANEIADKIQANLATLRELASDYVSLFPDTAVIVLKAPDDLTTLVKSRIAEHKAKEEARLEAERERIRQEEQEKVRAAQQDEDDTINRIWEAARRIEGNRVGYVQKAMSYFESGAGNYAGDPRPRVAAAVTEARAEMQEKLRIAQVHEDQERAEWEAREKLLQNAEAAKTDIAQAVEQGELAAPLAQDLTAIHDDLTSAAVSHHAISTAQRTAAAAPAEAVDTSEAPTLRIGEIALRLGWSMTGEQLRALGFEPAAKEKRAVLYRESQFPHICAAIAQHALAVRAAYLSNQVSEPA